MWYYQVSECSWPDFWALGFSVDCPDFVNLHHLNARRRKTSIQPHGASPLAGMGYHGRREGRDVRRLGVEGSRALAIRPLGLGMASLPPLSFPMRIWPGEMWGRQCPGWVLPGLLVICGSSNSNLPPGLK